MRSDTGGTAGDDELVVRVDGGLVRGTQRSTPSLEVLTWRGVPFAAPPTGERRWLGPQPIESWDGVRDASEFGYSPIQKPSSDAPLETISEDCLTVNVTRRRLTGDGLKPVLVFLYGGSNANGQSAYSLFEGLPLVETEDIVFVTGNYRLGPFGFTDFSSLSTPERVIEGNLGLRDQLGILRWVHENIEAFGGDPNRVTLSGHSAGALGVTTLMTVPAARGLFQAAIAQSSPVASVCERERNEHRVDCVLAAMGTTRENGADMLFSADPIELLVTGSDALHHEQELTPGMLAFQPVVDGDFLPEAPLDALAGGRAHPVPLLIGTVLNEGTFFAGANVPVTPGVQVHAMLTATDTHPHTRITSAYAGFPMLPATTAIMGDFLFWGPSIQAAAGHSQVAPVWMYRFDHGTPLLRGLRLTPTHGMDLPAVFGPNSTLSHVEQYTSNPRTFEHVTRSTRHMWMDMVLNHSERWPAYRAPERATFVIDRHLHLEHDPYPERRAVWEEFPYYTPTWVDRRARASILSDLAATAYEDSCEHPELSEDALAGQELQDAVLAAVHEAAQEAVSEADEIAAEESERAEAEMAAEREDGEQDSAEHEGTWSIAAARTRMARWYGGHLGTVRPDPEATARAAAAEQEHQSGYGLGARFGMQRPATGWGAGGWGATVSRAARVAARRAAGATASLRSAVTRTQDPDADLTSAAGTAGSAEVASGAQTHALHEHSHPTSDTPNKEPRP